ncbi:MAG: hypothetical protein LBD17_04505 [Endomicrobium sp.]|nr:hypothetical protein [Endomicrobium sp.]
MEQERRSWKIVRGIAKRKYYPNQIESICIDSTILKVHPDATGALKKMEFTASGAQEMDLQQKFI